MAIKKATKSKRDISITFSLDPVMDYCWSLNGEPKPGMAISGGGYDTVLELLQSNAFLTAISKYLGKNCFPESYIDDMKANEMNRWLEISDSTVESLTNVFSGIPVIDNRRKSTKKKVSKN